MSLALPLTPGTAPITPGASFSSANRQLTAVVARFLTPRPCRSLTLILTTGRPSAGKLTPVITAVIAAWAFSSAVMTA